MGIPSGTASAPAVVIVGIVAALLLAAVPATATGAAVPPEVTVSYGSDPLQTIQIYPSARPGSPVVVEVHGGGWRSSVNVNMEVTTAKQLRTAGYTVFDANYRSDDTGPAFPNETNDIIAATTYALGHAATYNGDQSRVSLLGGSSGGQLAAYAAEALNQSVPGMVHTVVTLSAPLDYPMGIAYWSSLTGSFALLHLANQLTALGCSTAATCPLATEDQWSPDMQVGVCPSNWLVLNSAAEETPVAQADAMTAALRAKGCAVTETILAGTRHGFHYANTNYDLPQIAAFMR